MIRIFAGFAVLTVMISVVSVYNLKQATEQLEDRKHSIGTDILKDREAIKVLRAEMAYLSRPERLERLSKRYLALNTTQTDQMEKEFTGLAVRDSVQMVSLPIDNFQLLLPRQKPNPKTAVRIVPSESPMNSSAVKVVRSEPHTENNEEKRLETVNLYERILQKIGN